MSTLSDVLQSQQWTPESVYADIISFADAASTVQSFYTILNDTRAGLYVVLGRDLDVPQLSLLGGVQFRLGIGSFAVGLVNVDERQHLHVVFARASVWLSKEWLSAIRADSAASGDVCLCEWIGRLSLDPDMRVKVEGIFTVKQQQFSLRQGQILITVQEVKPGGLPASTPPAAAAFFDQNIFLSVQADVAVNTSFDIPGLSGWRIRPGDGTTTPAFSATIVLSSEPGLLVENPVCRIEPSATYLSPMVETANGWEEALAPDGSKRPARIVVRGGSLALSTSGGFGLFGSPLLEIEPVQIGATGIIVRCSGLRACLTDYDPLPIGIPAGSRGFAVESVEVHLPENIQGVVPSEIIGEGLFFGGGGFTGRLSAEWTGGKAIELAGMECKLKSLLFDFKQNSLVESKLECELTLPFFDRPVNLDVSYSGDGELLASLSAVQPTGTTYDNGLIHFEKENVFKATLEGVSFEVKDGVSKLKVSGELQPTFQPGGGQGGNTGKEFEWPTFEIRELSIDSEGGVKFDGGFKDLDRPRTFDLKGFKLEITKMDLGRADDGGKYLSLSGKVNLIKNAPAGASVEGLRLTWYTDGRPPALTLRGVGVEFTIPDKLHFKGAVSYEQAGDDHRFAGELALELPMVNNLKIMGKAVFGSKLNADGQRFKYFAIYLDGEFGTGVPLWATGLSMYGLAGLFAINYAPNKPPQMRWYSIDKSQSWFHQPETGVIDIFNKWRPEDKSLAFGAGISVASTADHGFSFNGKFLLLLLTPGPVLMLLGRANILDKRAPKKGAHEGKFQAMIVLDLRAGYFLVGLDASWKADKDGGKLIEIAGSMEAYFSFQNPNDWRLDLGLPPMGQRIRATLAQAFSANAYFHLDGRKLALGVWVGKNDNYKWGPVRAQLEAWLAADAVVSFRPAQFHASLQFHGHLAVRVYRFKLGLGLDARLQADVFKPFHILGTLQIVVETPIKDFKFSVRLEWGPRPAYPVPEQLPVIDRGLLHPKTSAQWPDTGTLQRVPCDSRPYVTFAYPLNDAIGIGLNPSPNPGHMVIGDPSRGEGSALLRLTLQRVTLKQDGAVYTQRSVSGNVRPELLYGVWAPSPTSVGQQSKLMLFARNPLDFGKDADSWNPWLTGNLANYPCPPPFEDERLCFDFEPVPKGEHLDSGWTTDIRPSFKIEWDGGRPRTVVPVESSAGPRRGLLISGPPLRPGVAYVTNYEAHSVSAIDILTRRVVATVPVGHKPWGIALRPDGTHLYVVNREDSTVTVIETAGNTVVGDPIALTTGAAHSYLAVHPDGEIAYVTALDGGHVTVLDLTNDRVSQTFLVGEKQLGVAFHPDGQKAYVIHGAGKKSLSVIFVAGASVSKTIELGEDCARIVVSPDGRRAYIPAGDGRRLLVLDAETDTLSDSIPLGRESLDMCLSPDGHTAYVSHSDDGTVSTLDLATNTFEATTYVGQYPFGVQVSADGTTLLAANAYDGTVTFLDTATGRVMDVPTTAGAGSNSLAILDTAAGTVETHVAWVVCGERETDNTLSALELTTGQEIGQPVLLPKRARAVLLSPDGRRAYVVCDTESLLVVVDLERREIVGDPIPMVSTPSSLALSPDGKLLYVGSGKDAKIAIVQTDSLDVHTIGVPGPCTKIIFSHDGSKAFVSHLGHQRLTRISTDTGTIDQTNQLDDGPFGLAIDPTGSLLYVSFPASNSVRVLSAESLAEMEHGPLAVGAGAQDLALTHGGGRLCVGNFHDDSVSIIDTTAWSVLTTIDGLSTPRGLKVTEDDRQLVFTSYDAGNVSVIDLSTNTLLRSSTRVGSFGQDLALQTRRTAIEAPGGGPAEVIVGVPEGSAEVEVFYESQEAVTGWALLPSGQMPTPGVEGQGGVLHFVAADFELRQGIDRVRLTAAADWVLLGVCVKRPALDGGLKEVERFREAKQQTVQIWSAPQAVLDPGRSYLLEMEVKQRLDGIGELSGWRHEQVQAVAIAFQTAPPPGLGEPSLPGNNDLAADHQATGLGDLHPYVEHTVPVTHPPVGALPAVTKPVYRSYDAGVQFNEDYVEQMYVKAGRSLDLALFDGNNQPVRTARGSLAGGDNLWGTPPTVTLTENEARWIELTDAASCMEEKLDPEVVGKRKPLFSAQGQVLEPDAVYEGRLIPRLLWQPAVGGAGWEQRHGFTVWAAPEASNWKDYQIRALVKPDADQPNSVVFRWTSDGVESGNDLYFELLLNAAGKLWQLRRVAGNVHVLATGGIDLDSSQFYRLEIEATGMRVQVALDGTILCDLLCDERTLGVVPAQGTVGFRWSGPDSLADFGIRDFNEGAPVAYRFGFTTSGYTDFFHHLHSYQDEIGLLTADAAVDLAGRLSQAVTPTPIIGEAEARAFDELCRDLLGSAADQEPSRFDVSQIEGPGGEVAGWLLRSPQPLDWRRTKLKIFPSSKRPANRQPPQVLKITGVRTGAAEGHPSESVSLLLRERMDPTGQRIEARYYPGPLDETRAHARLGGFDWHQFPDVPVDPHLLTVVELDTAGEPSNWRVERGALVPGGAGRRTAAVFGEDQWEDYCVTLGCEASQGGAAGIVFRFSDEANFYSCSRDAVSGRVELAKVVDGTKTVLLQHQLAPGSKTRLIVSAIGPKLSIWLDGASVEELSDTTHATGRAGFYSDDNPSVRFRWLEVRRPPLEVYCHAVSDFSSDAALDGWRMSPLFAWTIQDDSLRIMPFSGQSPVALSPAAAMSDSIARCTLQLKGGDWAGLTVRHKDSENLCRFVLSNTQRRLERVASGVTSILWSDDQGVPNQIPTDLVLSALGPTLRAYQNGVLVCAAEDPAPLDGQAGICADPSTDASFWQFALYPAKLQTAPFLRDDFQPPTPGRWTVVPGQKIGQADGTLILTDAILPAEYRLTLRQRSGATGVLGIVWGYKDRYNYHCLLMDRQQGFRRLSRKKDGNLTVLWEDDLEIGTDQEYALTIDLTREELAAHLDGRELFRLSEKRVEGQFGCYSKDDPFGVVREMTADAVGWLPYAVIGEDEPLPAGTQMLFALERPTRPGTSPSFVQRRNSQVMPIGALLRLPYVEGDLRVVSAQGETQHEKHFGCSPALNPIPSFSLLRKADGSAFFMVAPSDDSSVRGLSLVWTYRLDNRNEDPQSTVFRKLGDLSYTEEEATIEIPVMRQRATGEPDFVSFPESRSAITAAKTR